MTETTPVRRSTGPRKRKFEHGAYREEVDRTVWIRHEPVAAPITMPIISSRRVTDADIGLEPDDIAQERAERYLQCAIAARLHRERMAAHAARMAAAERLMPGPTVHVEVPDDAVCLINPTDRLDATDKAILAEMQRIAAMPLPRWMKPDEAAA